jgi:RNA polymerase sigma-70 factor, ECF subfamily
MPEFSVHERILGARGIPANPRGNRTSVETERCSTNGGRSRDGKRCWSRLMSAGNDGDHTAYDRLVREIVPFVRALVTHRRYHPDGVEDVIQNVLLSVHRVRHTYDHRRPFSSWLAVIAHRRSIDMLRKQRRIATAEISDDFAYETFADPAAALALERGERAAILSSAIAGLPASQRQALELVKLREVSLAEASRATGKSVAALKVNVHRAITSLRIGLADPVERQSS